MINTSNIKFILTFMNPYKNFWEWNANKVTSHAASKKNLKKDMVYLELLEGRREWESE